MNNRFISRILSMLIAVGVIYTPVSAADTAVIADRSVGFAEIMNLGGSAGGIGGLDAEDMSACLGSGDSDRAFALDMYKKNTIHTFSFALYPEPDFRSIGFYVRGSGFFFNRRTVAASDLNMNQWNDLCVKISVEQTMEIWVNGELKYEMDDSTKNTGDSVQLRMSVAGEGEGLRGYIHNPRYRLEMPLPDGYAPPTVTAECTAARVMESEAALVTASAWAYETVEEVAFYVDGELVFTDMQQPYEMPYIFPVGAHAVYAVVKDNYGKTQKSDICIVESLPDTRPRIETSLKDGESYERAQLTNVSVQVKMSEAELAEGWISADGKKYADITEKESITDLSGLPLGRHAICIYVMNSLGESKEVTMNITVIKTLEASVYSNTYDSASGVDGTTNDRGYIRYEEVTPGFGKSVLVGADGEYDISLEGPWIAIPLAGCNTRLIMEFDLYVERMSGSVEAMFITKANHRSTLFKIENAQIIVSGGAKSCGFSEKSWHHVRLDMNMESNTFDLYIDGIRGIEAAEMNCPEGSAANFIRMISKLAGVPNNFFALDNTTVTTISAVPYIYKITSSNGISDNIVSAKDNAITAYFNAPLSAVSVYPSKFSIGGAVIKNAVYNAGDNSVTLELEKPLAEGNYQLVTAENLVIGSGELYGEKLYAGFQAAYTPVDAEDAQISDSGVFSTALYNAADMPCDVYMIMHARKNNMIQNRSVKRIVLNPGINYVSEKLDGYSPDAEVWVALWDSFDHPYCILLCGR